MIFPRILYSSSFLLIALGGHLTVDAASISEILKTIETNNPSLQSTASENQARELEIRSENTLPPTSIEYSPFFRSGISGVASSELIVSQEFDFPTLYASRSRQATLERNVLDSQLAQSRRELLLQAQSALLDLIRLRKENGILQARLKDTEKLLEAYGKQLDLGAVTILDFNKVKLERQELQREILENESEATRIENELTVYNGGKPLELANLDYEVSIDNPSLLPDLEALLLADPSIRAAAVEVDAASHGVKVAKEGWLPGLTVGYRRNTEEKEASNGFLVGASLPLFSNSAKKRAADARLAASRLSLETATVNAEAEYRAALRLLEKQKAVLGTYDLKLIFETLSLYSKSLEAGQINLTTYYTETSALYDSLLTQTRLENEIQQTVARLRVGLL